MGFEIGHPENQDQYHFLAADPTLAAAPKCEAKQLQHMQNHDHQTDNYQQPIDGCWKIHENG